MDIIRAEHAGFCFGVDRALKMTREARESDPTGDIHTLGPLIHNPQVVEKLNELDIGVVETIEELDKGTVIIRSHGVAPQIIKKAEEKGLNVVDATCPFVKRAQKRARFLYHNDYDIIVIGDESHPEVKGLLAYTGYSARVISAPEEVQDLPELKKVGVVAQTTQSISTYSKILTLLLPDIEEIRTYNTVCTTTIKRQKEAFRIARGSDLMIVVGGYNSANTKRLAELCKEAGAETHHIETVEELSKSWFKDCERVGVTAGASTPDWIIKEVKTKMMDWMEDEKLNSEEEIEETGAEEVEEEVKEPETEEADPAEEVEPAEEQAESEEDMYDDVAAVAKGDKVSGTVVRVGEGEVLVDIGYKSEGIIPLNELTIKPVDNPEDVLSEGDEVEAEVINVDEEEGTVYLSKREIDFDKLWERIHRDFEDNNTISARVTKRVKGGLVVDLDGLRGFVPGSHVDIRYIEDFDQFIGETLDFKIIEVERDQNNIVLSRKEVLEEERAEEKEKTLAELEEGQIREGVVTKLVDFGAFVDIGGIEGLLHISEMSWSRIQHPSDILSEGDEIEVMVLDVNIEDERISLGLKQVQPNPWVGISDRYDVGDVIEAEITKLVSFGAFARIEEGIEGLIHISQLAQRHIDKPEEVVSVDDKVKVKVISVNEEEQKIGLSMKEIEQEEELGEYEQDEGGITIGDMVGDLFKDDDE